MELARSLQRAMAGRDVSRALARIESKRFADAVISPELRRTMQELRKVFTSPAMKKTVKTIGSPSDQGNSQAASRNCQGCEGTREGLGPQAGPLMAREDKTRVVDRTYAETRLGDTPAYLQQADVSRQLVDGPRRHATVVSSAVLAGVARRDAACALALGLVSAGAHAQALRVLLARVSGSTRAVGDLSKLVAIKAAAQYTGKSMGERQTGCPSPKRTVSPSPSPSFVGEDAHTPQLVSPALLVRREGIGP